MSVDVISEDDLRAVGVKDVSLHVFNDVFNPFESEFIIVIFIHCKPRIAVAILDL